MARMILFIAGLAIWHAGAAGAGERVVACGGDSNWPPMSYQMPGETLVQGLSADVLRAIFANDTELNIQLRPWVRCLTEASRADGADIVMSFLHSPERDKQFFYSRPYATLTPAYIFLARRYPTPPVRSLGDLSQLRVCALRGASTSYTQLPADKIDSGSSGYASLIGKLNLEHCDVVVDMQEVLLGHKKLGIIPLDSRLHTITLLPQTEPRPMHFGVSKDNPRAARLIERIDRGIAELRHTGTLAKLLASYQLSK
jgi:ABC-type amino acid transport substrate-binding protein